MANTFALLRLLPMSDRDKDAEILALRHQLTGRAWVASSPTMDWSGWTGRWDTGNAAV